MQTKFTLLTIAASLGAGATLSLSLPSSPWAMLGDTVRHNGAKWVRADNLYNDGTRIGINTKSPGERLHVAGNAQIGVDSGEARLFLRGGDSSRDTDISFSQDGQSKWFFGLLNNVNDDSLSIVSSAAGSQDALTIRHSTGNVGIGTTSPSSKLHVQGDAFVSGTLTKGGGAFKIDHPLDPENKYLSHSFVESPDMMNVYNGNVIIDDQGEAWVELPTWFETLNRDFRYQLTAICNPGPNLHIAKKIDGNRFKIAGGVAGMEVSWQLTGIRQDPYANAHRIQVEEDKPESVRGTYLYPDLLDQRDGITGQ